MNASNEVCIQVRNLSKAFRLYARPADLFFEAITRKRRHREFWALQDVSFNVRRGHVLGILGRNGAGKSTLLKILTGTLDWTSGQVLVNGRISSILELGTGFNPDYTGRENIYLGGLMVGLSRDEILGRMDWIIEFSELKDFIDQPFKTYSTGMQARLTFSTAVCTSPDLLIVDEALSVGDARFQRKSFAKFEEFRTAGHTIVFVSHDVNAIATLCDYAIILENGRIYDQGEPHRISQVYYRLLFGGDREQTAVTQAESEPPLLDAASSVELTLDASIIAHEQGHAWTADLAACSITGDSNEYPRHSPLSLFEDRMPLGPAHAAHETIRQFGKGAFSHWGTRLYFSTSDNSDPTSNGRVYCVSTANSLAMPAAATSSFADNRGEIRNRETMRRNALHKLKLAQPYDQDNPHQMRLGNKKAEILDFGILDKHGNRVIVLDSGCEYDLFFRAVYYEDVRWASVGFLIRTLKGVEVFGATMQSFNMPIPPRSGGELIEARLKIRMWLTNGIYFLTVNTADPYAERDVQYDSIYDGYQFEINRHPQLLHSSIVNLEPELEVISI